MKWHALILAVLLFTGTAMAGHNTELPKGSKDVACSIPNWALTVVPASKFKILAGIKWFKDIKIVQWIEKQLTKRLIDKIVGATGCEGRIYGLGRILGSASKDHVSISLEWRLKSLTYNRTTRSFKATYKLHLPSAGISGPGVLFNTLSDTTALEVTGTVPVGQTVSLPKTITTTIKIH